MIRRNPRISTKAVTWSPLNGDGDPMENIENDVVNKSPLVSVIMNCFNGEAFLKEAIDSVYAQTYKNWEIIFWDNASTDYSREIACSFGKELRYFRGDVTIPLGAARNKALEQVRGEYIVILDCDDLLLPLALHMMVKALEGSEYALAYGGSIIIDENGKQIRKWTPKPRLGDLFKEQLIQFEIGLPSVIISTKKISEGGIRFNDHLKGFEDYCLFMELAAQYAIRAISEVISKYRIHQGALTNRTISLWAEEREYVLRFLSTKYPSLRERHKRAFRIAFSRCGYYRARYYVSKRERVKAIKELAKHMHVDLRFIGLLVLLLLPVKVWDAIHRKRTGRSVCL